MFIEALPLAMTHPWPTPFPKAANAVQMQMLEEASKLKKGLTEHAEMSHEDRPCPVRWQNFLFCWLSSAAHCLSVRLSTECLWHHVDIIVMKGTVHFTLWFLFLSQHIVAPLMPSCVCLCVCNTEVISLAEHRIWCMMIYDESSPHFTQVWFFFFFFFLPLFFFLFTTSRAILE